MKNVCPHCGQDLGERLLTAHEVAASLRVSMVTLLKKVKSGDLKAIKLGRAKNSPLRFRAIDVEEYLYEQRTVKESDSQNKESANGDWAEVIRRADNQ